MNAEKKSLAGLILPILILAIIAVGIWSYLNRTRTPALNTYHEKTYGFDVKYPSTWEIQDSMTKDGCCLFIVNVNISTTTAENASGTPVTTITEKEPVKIQIGHYYRPSAFDPFKMATNTPITLGKNAAYIGTSNNTPYYLIPMTELDGIGVAYFTAIDNTDTTGTRQSVENVLSSIVFTGTSTATSTAN